MEYARRLHKIPTAKSAPPHISGLQPFILKQDVRSVTGRETRLENIMVAQVLAEVVKSSLGPKGMDKMVVDSEGLIWVTNDGATILSKLNLQHPIALILTEMAQIVDKEVGDGTTSAVLLAGELLKKGGEMLNRKIHAKLILDGYAEALEKALELYDKIALPVNCEKDALKNIVKTAISGKIVSENMERIAEVAVEAALRVKKKYGESYDVDLFDVNVEKKAGGSITDIQLVEGFAFCREPAHPEMPKQVKDAKIAVLQGEIRTQRRGRSKLEHTATIENPEQMKTFLNERTSSLSSIVEKIEKAGAKVVILEKGIDPVAAHFFKRKGILVIRRVVIEDIERIAKAVGGRVVSYIDDLSKDDLGMAEAVEVKKIGGEEWAFIEGCKNAKCVTILVRGGTDKVIDEVERSIHDALCVIRDVLRCPKVVVGGGASEVEVAMHLKDWAGQFSGREQFAIHAFADALESLAWILTENAGLDPLELIPRLRAQHRKGETLAGIDVLDGRIKNMAELNVYDPLAVKQQAVKSATEAAFLILKIDESIAARKLEKQEKYAKMIDKGRDPEYKKKIYREYKLESLEPGSES